MPEELKYIASVVGFEKVDQALNNQTKALTNTATAANKLNTSYKSVGAGAKEAAGNITGFGTSLPTAAMAIFTVAIVQGVKALIEYATSISNTAEANLQLNRSLLTSQASVAGSIEKLSALAAIAQDVNRSDAERSEAIGRLNKDYEVFNKSLTLSNINTEESVNLINKQTASLIRNAQIKGLENLISKETEKRAEALTQKLGSNLSTYEKTRSALLGLFTVGGNVSGRFDAIAQSVDNTNQSIKESKERTDIFTKALQDLLSESATAGDLFNEPLIKLKPEKVKKDIKAVVDELKMIPRKLEVELIVAPVLKLSAFGPSLEEFRQRIATGNFGQITVPVRPKIDISDAALKLEEDLTELNETATKIAQQVGTNIATAIGDSIGNGLANITSVGDFFGGLFASIFKALGAGLRQLGVYAIATSKLILALKTSIGTTLGIAGGVALIALGTLISAAANKLSRVPGFAQGGLVGGTGNRDTVNALLTPGEFVITKSAVQRIGINNLQALNGGGVVQSVGAGVTAGTQQINGTLEAVIDGKLIRLVLNRADASLSRVG